MGESIKKERILGPAPTVQLRRLDGTTAGDIQLEPSVFAMQPNMAVMHQVVNAQLAAARSGTQNTKTRSEVEGGSAKPWRQKGTGRARQGSVRAPHFVGGGVALGPKPRSYKQKTPKKMVQLALRSALSDRMMENKVIVVDRWSFSSPKTRDAQAALRSLGVEGSVLVVVGYEDENAALSFRNLPNVHVLYPSELNTFDVLRHDYVVFSSNTVPHLETEPQLEVADTTSQGTAQ